MTLLGDLDIVADYLEHHNVPRYMDEVVARLREHEKRLREEMRECAAAARLPDAWLASEALRQLNRINGGPVKP